MPTSGMPILALPASRWTVASSQDSSSDCGGVIRRTPIVRLAIHLDKANEINAPPKPKTAEKTSKLATPPPPKRIPKSCSMTKITR